MDAAFVFGTLGNLSAALGIGWSSEEAFSWAIGAESELTLPLPANGLATILRLDVYPAIFPPKVASQRLMIRSGKIVLGSFEITARQTLVIPLPAALTGGADRLHLTLLHPDAARPRDHLPVDDSRRLALCFHSASLEQSEPEGTQATVSPDPAVLEPVHGVIAGDSTAMRIYEVISRLPCLKGRFGIRFLDLAKPLDRAAGDLPPETLRTMRFCWIQLNAGRPETRDPLRQQLPADCALRTFYAPIINAFWPFQGPDRRAVPEPGRHSPSRYPYGDRLAQPLAAMTLPDDVIYLMYEMSARQEAVDFEEIYANDLRRWRAEGRKSDLRLADFIERHLGTSRLFIAPNRVGPVLLREMVDQFLDDALVRDIATPETLAAELDALLEGYAGWQQEVPIHKRVADHFNLAWWSPDTKYRWENNLRTHREHILDYIRWAQWRP
ncbi:MAG TPA: WcbI family polysaccharide biosynthesis putative acetyltransferase [Rhodopila sp.]|nr:WcbI family polysaccharide biosynthesis putative acetyltransferase [Rhodopila sp.]